MKAITPELALALRTLHLSRQIPRQRLADLLNVSPTAVDWVLDGNVLPKAQPDWSRTTDELGRHFERMAETWELEE